MLGWRTELGTGVSRSPLKVCQIPKRRLPSLAYDLVFTAFSNLLAGFIRTLSAPVPRAIPVFVIRLEITPTLLFISDAEMSDYPWQHGPEIGSS